MVVIVCILVIAARRAGILKMYEIPFLRNAGTGQSFYKDTVPMGRLFPFTTRLYRAGKDKINAPILPRYRPIRGDFNAFALQWGLRYFGASSLS